MIEIRVIGKSHIHKLNSFKCTHFIFSSQALVTQLVSPAAAGPLWDVSTQPSCDKVYVTLLPHFLGT